MAMVLAARHGSSDRLARPRTAKDISLNVVAYKVPLERAALCSPLLRSHLAFGGSPKGARSASVIIQ